MKSHSIWLLACCLHLQDLFLQVLRSPRSLIQILGTVKKNILLFENTTFHETVPKKQK